MTNSSNDDLLVGRLLHNQYVSDFHDFRVILKRMKRAFERHQNHHNPIHIDGIEGVQVMNRHSTDSSFDG